MNTDPLAHRVVRRYRGVIHGATRFDYSDADKIEAASIMTLLKPMVGPLLRLTCWHPSIGMPNTVAFDAVTPDDRIVRGRLVLHAAVHDNAVVSWADVIVDFVDRAVPF